MRTIEWVDPLSLQICSLTIAVHDSMLLIGSAHSDQPESICDTGVMSNITHMLRESISELTTGEFSKMQTSTIHVLDEGLNRQSFQDIKGPLVLDSHRIHWLFWKSYFLRAHHFYLVSDRITFRRVVGGWGLKCTPSNTKTICLGVRDAQILCQCFEALSASEHNDVQC